MTAPATPTDLGAPGQDPRSGPSCTTPATPASRCGDATAATRYSSMSTTSPPGISPGCAGTTQPAGSGPASPPTSRWSTKPPTKPSRPASPPDHHTAAAPHEQRHGLTCYADGYTARSASDACKDSGSAARPTTAAGIPPSTPPPPTSTTPNRSIYARPAWCAVWTLGWPNCSAQPTSTTPATP